MCPKFVFVLIFICFAFSGSLYGNKRQVQLDNKSPRTQSRILRTVRRIDANYKQKRRIIFRVLYQIK